VICNLIKFVLYFIKFLCGQKSVHGPAFYPTASIRAVAAMTPAEIREVEEGVTDFLRRVGTNAKLHENKTKKMCCVSARRLSIHKTYNKFKNKFAE
jgi:hypothetical protein